MSGDSQSETYFPLSNETSVESEAEYINSNYRQDTALEQQSAAGRPLAASFKFPKLMKLLDHTHSQNGNLKVPYFRYFGPTAIVPGFKQMVVSLRENRKNSTAGFSIPSIFSKIMSRALTNLRSLPRFQFVWIQPRETFATYWVKLGHLGGNALL